MDAGPACEIPTQPAAPGGQSGRKTLRCSNIPAAQPAIPKAATALHRNVVANTLQVKNWFVIMEDGKETLLMAIPLFHVYGMVAGMLYAIGIGASMVMIPNARDIPDVLENINKYHPTTFPGCTFFIQCHQ